MDEKDDKRQFNGRPNGVKNKNPQRLISAIMASFQKVGGVTYLEKLANEQPVAYAGLLRAIIPKNITVKGSSTQHVVVHDSREWLNSQINALSGGNVIESTAAPAQIESKPADNVMTLSQLRRRNETNAQTIEQESHESHENKGVQRIDVLNIDGSIEDTFYPHGGQVALSAIESTIIKGDDSKEDTKDVCESLSQLIDK